MTFKEAYEYLKEADELNVCAQNDKEALSVALTALKWAYQVIDTYSKFLGRRIDSEIKHEE